MPAEKTAARFGEEVIRFADPDGLLLELIGRGRRPAIEPWRDSSVPAEYSLRGFHSVSSALEGYEQTAKLLTEKIGYRLVEESENRFRFAAPGGPGAGKMMDLLCTPENHPGRVAAGTVHHIAFRSPTTKNKRVAIASD